ncbi:ClpXP protease specificity-enhancing factor [Calidifontimicrobium sp. SYSU G02091]|uniref:ClpXP protease specificity-enhancing factor n=1 Tax=Calidifontimicrobium sp. SYSU G02091 TaxID=2926421 RepID=UPI001F535CE7|nr:ClpXP protease specificity-enhancing factor [Calidifontimicrobium sp. SYSU G02091]MCI1192949.1 ClpXP protease specificity-enhancing factor [Calidifontimicrobium sp. SYSU G02091]
MTSPPTASESQGTSTRPYLIRALHDWCTDNGFTPYIAVFVDDSVQVPREYVKNNEIVLNVGFEATSGLKLGNDVIEFKARFGGAAREIVVPVDHVVAIYARENGQGMAFPLPTAGAPAEPAAGVAAPAPRVAPAPRGLRLASVEGAAETSAADGGDEPPPDDHPPSRPSLKRVK